MAYVINLDDHKLVETHWRVCDGDNVTYFDNFIIIFKKKLKIYRKRKF